MVWQVERKGADRLTDFTLGRISKLYVPPDLILDPSGGFLTPGLPSVGRDRAESRLSTLPFGTGLATFTAGGYWLISRCHRQPLIGLLLSGLIS